MTIETNVTFPLNPRRGRQRAELAQAMFEMEVGATIRTDDLSKASQVHAAGSSLGRKGEYRTSTTDGWLYIQRVGPGPKQ